jgi:hypothetical protein
VIGGPVGDCGLTGRKIIVDTYGGMARHGGGAFSGKDPSKVDRSAAYAARYVAKNIVAAGLADRCEVQVSYAIGVAEPTSISVTTFGTGKISDDKIEKLIRKHFDLRPYGIIKMLDLIHPIYQHEWNHGASPRREAATATSAASPKSTNNKATASQPVSDGSHSIFEPAAFIVAANTPNNSPSASIANPQTAMVRSRCAFSATKGSPSPTLSTTPSSRVRNTCTMATMAMAATSQMRSTGSIQSASIVPGRLVKKVTMASAKGRLAIRANPMPMPMDRLTTRSRINRAREILRADVADVFMVEASVIYCFTICSLSFYGNVP